MSETLLEVRKLEKFYPLRGGFLSRPRGWIKAVEDVSFALRKGETLGLVGESGCGKSTLARLIMRLEDPTSGSLFFEGHDVTSISRKELFALRREVQMVFQDPYSSLNPRLTVGDIVREPLDIHQVGKKNERAERTAELLRSVGLEADMAERYPHEFSGGQRQRVGIARALALDPKLIVADEPVSALDVSVQAQVINLMVRLQREFSLTYIFISHDLSVVEYISDNIAIMYLGRIVEIGPKTAIFERPAHPYTRGLIKSTPVHDPRVREEHVPITGELPSPLNPPAGCPFHPRCPFAVDECRQAVPPLEPASREEGTTHQAACIRKHELPPFDLPRPQGG